MGRIISSFLFILMFILNGPILKSQGLSYSDSLILSEYQEKISYYESRNFDSTIYFLNKLEELDLDLKLKVKAYLNLGNMFLFKGDLHLATKNYLKVKELGESSGDIIYLSAAKVSLAAVNIREEKFSESLKLLNEVESDLSEYSPKNEDENKFYTKLLITCYINQSIALSEMQEYGSAGKYIDKSIKLSQSVNDTKNLAIAYSDKADLLQKSGHFNEAIVLHRKALKLRTDDNMPVDITRSINNIGKLYYEMGNTDSALYYLNKGFISSQQLNLIYDVYTSSKLLSDLYYEAGDFPKAYQFLKISQENKDSYRDLEKLDEISNLNLQYKLNLLNQEQEIREKRLFATIGFLVLFVIIFVLLYIIQRKAIENDRRIREKLILNKQIIEEQLEFKNKKLVTNVMHHISINEMMLNVANKLKEFSETLNSNQKKVLSGVIKELRKGTDKTILDEFEHAFQDVHTDFYKKLDRKFSLTPSERRMAAFIKLNLSSKEISAITGQSVRTIDVTRYRLRKKLNINNTTTNLSSYLSKL